MIWGSVTRCRPIEPTDQQFIHALNSDPEVRSNVVGWDFPGSLSSQFDWFTSVSSPTTQRFLAETLDGRPLGVTGLWDIDWHNRNAISGIKLGGGDGIRGRGHGTDIIMSMMAFAFNDVGLERLHCSILASNTASIKLYTRKCGWSVEGRARSHVWRLGSYVDLVYAGILKHEFERLPAAKTYAVLQAGAQPHD